MANPAREHLKKLRRDIQSKERGDVMTQEEIDVIFSNRLSDKEIDKLHGIKRKPWLGFLISCVGTLIIWSLIGYFIFKII
tara:strand:+ start:560 stop:799 length:240 start_codon:yes stop_codon:yes gene_type:complete